MSGGAETRTLVSRPPPRPPPPPPRAHAPPALQAALPNSSNQTDVWKCTAQYASQADLCAPRILHLSWKPWKYSSGKIMESKAHCGDTQKPESACGVRLISQVLNPKYRHTRRNSACLRNSEKPNLGPDNPASSSPLCPPSPTLCPCPELQNRADSKVLGSFLFSS